MKITAHGKSTEREAYTEFPTSCIRSTILPSRSPSISVLAAQPFLKLLRLIEFYEGKVASVVVCLRTTNKIQSTLTPGTIERRWIELFESW